MMLKETSLNKKGLYARLKATGRKNSLNKRIQKTLLDSVEFLNNRHLRCLIKNFDLNS